MRTGVGLPFVCTLYMKLILEGILARVQRDMKVVINHLIWMANHAHIIIEAKDTEQCKRFYGEVQKQLTEAVKRLLGLDHLNLWRSNETSVVHLGDKEGVMRRIAYLYANPARADLIESIDQYPGVSSWQGFLANSGELEGAISKDCRWIQAPMIPSLPLRSANTTQDLRLTEKMLAKAVRSHRLVLKPNSWMRRYGITTSEEVEQTNRSIIAMVREYEESARLRRSREGKKSMGVSRLRREEIRLNYKPTRVTRRIFVYAVDKEIRIGMIKRYRAFCEACREAYLRWKAGDFDVKWPPGAYRPPQPNNVNWFAT
ncbi:MAG: hypothetical protein RL417_186 [Pseudomonadota bacterium]